MTTSRQRWLPHLLHFAAFAIIAAIACHVNAAVTSCETAALTNSNFEEGTADGKAAHWCDNWGRGYSRVLTTPAKYNHVPIVSIPMNVPAAERYAGTYQIVNLNQTRAENVFVGAMIKGSDIVLDGRATLIGRFNRLHRKVLKAVRHAPMWRRLISIPGIGALAALNGSGATLNVGFKVDCAVHPNFCEYHGNPTDSTVWCATLPSAGTFHWRWVGLDSHTCGIGYVDSATRKWISVPIKSAAIFPILGGATGTAYFDQVRLMQFPPGPGAVTFMFDDGYKSTRTNAKPILDRYAFVGSSAVVSDLVGTAGYMTPHDLRDLQAAGWDIASHSATHPSMPSLSTMAAETEMQKSKTTLTALGLTIDTFVWPQGDYDQSLIALAQAGLPTAPLYKSARNTESDLNAYGTFPYALKTLEVLETTPLHEVQAWIDDLKAGGRWGIFLLHDVADNPDQYAITPTMLDQLAQLVASSGVAVINYRQGYQTFANIPAP